LLSFFETDQVDNGRRAGDVDLSGFQRRNHGHLVAKHGNLDAVKIWLVRLPVVAVPTALGYWGGQMIIRRARERTGIARLHSLSRPEFFGGSAAWNHAASAVSRW
jgi:hypothetical protein